MAQQPLFNPIMQFLDNNGGLLAGGSVAFYEVGATFLKPIYADRNGRDQLANPNTLNARGEPTNSSSDPTAVFGSGTYDVILRDSSGATIWTARGVRLSSISAWGERFLLSTEASAGRQVLGLGTVATRNVGTTANTIPLLDANAALPAVNGGSLLNILPANYLSGLNTSNSGGDAEHDILVRPGSAKDQGNAFDLRLPGTIIKRLDAPWAVGTNQGGLEIGTALSANTWYYIYLIGSTDGTLTDVLFSISAAMPTLPSGYTYSRRIGSLRTDATSNVTAYLQAGSEWYWDAPPLDVDATVGTTRAFSTLTVPPVGATYPVYTNILVDHATESSLVYLSNSSAADLPPSETTSPLATLRSDAGTPSVSQGQFLLTNGLLFYRASVGTTRLRVATLGWVDRRGMDG